MSSSGFVSLPLIAAMLRLRASESGALRNLALPVRISVDLEHSAQRGLHIACDCLDYRNGNRVAELPVGLCVRHRNLPGPPVALEAHQTRALGRSQPAG